LDILINICIIVSKITTINQGYIINEKLNLAYAAKKNVIKTTELKGYM
jgi:hypothetical protein